MTARQFTAWIAQTSRRGAWAPILVFTLHMVAVWAFDAYTHFPRIDIPFHLAGGAAIAYFLHHAVRAATDSGLTRPTDLATHTVLVLALTGNVAVVWECCELLLDRISGWHAQLGIEDALGDIFTGLAGAIVFAVAKIFIRERRTRTEPRAAGLQGRCEPAGE